MKHLLSGLLLVLGFLHISVHASEPASELTSGKVSDTVSSMSDRLQTKNYVLLMRHAYAPGVGDPAGYSLARCDTQRVLNDEGKQQATRIGQWLKAQGIKQAQVHTNVWCRCQETAELLGLGPAKVEPSLASFFDEPHKASASRQQLQDFIAKTLPTKGERALILVTHHVNIQAYMGQNIGSGDMVLVRVNAQGQLLGHQLYPSP